VPQPHGQSHRPEIGTPLADQANRDGGAERCPEPAVQKRVAVDRALIDSSEQLRRNGAWRLVQTATPPHAPPRARRPSVPGSGTMWRVVLRDASHDLTRFPRVQDGVASGRLVNGAKESAGTREGTSGAKLGKTARTWAVSEAAGLVLRHHPAARKTSPAWSPPLARATR
jgi:hypothetical protein